jgi:alkylation response protein AidB-like acyl-CoA dehydrogenase
MSDLAELHDELRGVARAALARPDADWRRYADAGWLGLEVPDALGGAGATFAEVLVVAEELGRAAADSAFLGTVVLGVGALALADGGAGRDELLAAVAAGEATVAVAGGPLGHGAGTAPFVLDRSEGAARLSGRATFVADATRADQLLLVARDGDQQLLVAVPQGAPGLAVDARPVLDVTRALADVEADALVVDSALAWPLPADGLGRLADRAALAVAADSLGLAEAMLAATVAYAKERVQFDRPIGSFQAVKHACADLLVAVTVGRELLQAAVDAHLTEDPDGPRLASMAKAQLGDAGVDVVGVALQLHGGIGYTWESGIHRYLKRALLNRSLFGSSRAHRGRVTAGLVG